MSEALKVADSLQSAPAQPEALVCPGCGKQIEDFRSDGTWGCHSCGERGDWASE